MSCHELREIAMQMSFSLFKHPLQVQIVILHQCCDIFLIMLLKKFTLLCRYKLIWTQWRKWNSIELIENILQFLEGLYKVEETALEFVNNTFVVLIVVELLKDISTCLSRTASCIQLFWTTNIKFEFLSYLNIYHRIDLRFLSFLLILIYVL